MGVRIPPPNEMLNKRTFPAQQQVGTIVVRLRIPSARKPNAVTDASVSGDQNAFGARICRGANYRTADDDAIGTARHGTAQTLALRRTHLDTKSNERVQTPQRFFFDWAHLLVIRKQK
uniref:Uncharacterized protein n=1 Tax=Globodera rostochiensis TaxID=31243 RepID=A0A914HXJ2_GLORO